MQTDNNSGSATPPPPLPMEPTEWHFTHNGQPAGVATWSQLGQRAASGQLLATDLVWKDGMPGWVAASSVQGLFLTAKPPSAPPPIPKSVTPPPLAVAGASVSTAPAAATEGLAPSQPTASGKVTFEIIIEPQAGVISGDKTHVAVDIDGVRVYGPQATCLEDGFRISSPMNMRCTTGVHSIKLGPSTGVIKKLFGMFSKSKEPTEPPIPEQVYRVEFHEAGHYEVKFRFEEPRTRRALPVEAVPRKVRDHGPGLFAKIGKAWSDSVESSRRSQLHRLWKPTNDQGNWFIFTEDGAMLRQDGLATKFRWLDNETVELYENGCDATVKIQVLSLSENELIMKTDGQSGHFCATDTITQTELKRKEAEEARARAEFNEKAVKVAGTVAAILAVGGIAILCGAVAVAANASGGDVGSRSSGGHDATIPESNAGSSSAGSSGAATVKTQAIAKQRQVVAVCGAVIISSDERTFSYKKRCDCGHVDLGVTHSSIPAAGSTINSSFQCSKCRSMQQIRIQGS